MKTMKKVLTKNWVIPFIQISMALIYISFGALKLLGGSPAEELVFLSTFFVGFERFYPLLGRGEIIIGLGFLSLWWYRRIGFLLFIGHMIGTFLPFITTPELCLDTCSLIDIPSFTLVGQYIVKNLSLIGCGLVLFFLRDGNTSE